jgi:uncharacterized protein
MQHVAIIGSGIAGLGAATALAGRCRVELFEAAAAPGGHVLTVPVPGGPAVDMGFIVYNETTYPHLSRLLARLGVATRATSMSFSVRTADGALEYGSAGPRALFARRRDLTRRRHWRLVGGMLALLGHGRTDLRAGLPPGMTLAEYLAWRRVPAEVGDGFAVPLAGALWSMAPARAGAFPAETFLRFLHQHGMLRPVAPLRWRTIAGGSRTYVDALLARLPVALHLGAPVARVERDGAGVTVALADGARRRFDRVVLAVHPDRALALLSEPSCDERRVLGAIRFGENEVVLHTYAAALPARPAARSSWNVLADDDRRRVSVTYWMNRLQGLPGPTQYCVTLNPRRPLAPGSVLHTATLAHPLFDFAAVAAQREVARLQGQRRTYVCGAWCGYGFHEDGLRAGLRAAARLLADGERAPARAEAAA